LGIVAAKGGGNSWAGVDPGKSRVATQASAALREQRLLISRAPYSTK